MGSRVFAIDIGGTKVECAWVFEDGTVERIGRIDTVQSGGALLSDILALAQSTTWASNDIVGVGCGGPMTKDGVSVSPLNIPSWVDFPLHAALTDALQRPVFIDNDAKALALAEGRFGAARGLKNYVSMVVSTGIGGGIVIDGSLLHGALGNAGHIGHIVVSPNGALCGCGTRGCLEAEASGTAIRNSTGRPASKAPLDVRQRTGTMVGRGVAAVASLLDVTQFFIAGSVALGFGAPFFDAANLEARRLAGLEFAKNVSILPSELRDLGPILGAACVAWRTLES